MLSDTERRELEDALKHYPDKRSGTIDVLLLVQRRRGWISDESILDIAQFLEMTSEDVDSVATFYNLIFRKPVGRHVAFLCDSISCWIMGYEQVREQLKNSMTSIWADNARRAPDRLADRMLGTVRTGASHDDRSGCVRRGDARQG